MPCDHMSTLIVEAEIGWDLDGETAKNMLVPSLRGFYCIGIMVFDTWNTNLYLHWKKKKNEN